MIETTNCLAFLTIYNIFLVKCKFLQTIPQFPLIYLSINFNPTISIMQQTILTENNVQATIQIPQDKLKSKNPNFTCNTASQPQVIIMPQCGSHRQTCCCLPPQQNNSQNMMTMIRELEIAYQEDVQGLNRRILDLQGDLKERKMEIEKYRNNQREYLLIIQRSRIELQKEKQERISLVKVCERLRKERETIMRTKIHEFHAAKAQELLNCEEEISKLRKIHHIELTQTIKSHTINFEGELVKQNQTLRNSEADLDNERRNSIFLKEQIEIHKNQLIASTSKHIQRESQIKHSFEEKALKLRKQIDLSRSENQQIAKLKSDLSTSQQRNQDMINEVLYLKDTQIPAYRNQFLSIEDQLRNQCGLTAELTLEKNELRELYGTVKNGHQEALGKLEVALDTILKLEDQNRFLRQDKNKVYEVKIEKIVDRKQEFELLQSEVQTLRRGNSQLRSELTRISTHIIDKDQIMEQLSRKLEFSLRKSSEMTKLIEERQKSFAWIVQREIEADIQFNKGNQRHQGKIYRVMPLKEKLPKILETNIRVQPFSREILIVKEETSL